jgi:hypothetical protein
VHPTYRGTRFEGKYTCERDEGHDGYHARKILYWANEPPVIDKVLKAARS